MSAPAPAPFQRVRVRTGQWVHLRRTGTRTTLCGKPSYVVLESFGLVDCADCADRARAAIERDAR